MQDFSLLDHIGACIKATRKERSLTQEQLAKEADISVRLVKAIENGKTNTTVVSLHQIVCALNISADVLFYPKLDSRTAKLKAFEAALSRCTDIDQEIVLKSAQYATELILEKRKKSGEVCGGNCDEP